MEKYYSIKDLENLSGIKAHTIRIWEKRYELLTPARTETNIRLYDTDQLRKLLNVAVLLKKGMKISQVSELSESGLNDKVEKSLSKDLISEPSIEPLIEGLIVSMVEFNELRFEKIFHSAVLRMGLKNTMLKLIYPVLNRVGLFWGVNKVSPAQEHFISNLIRQKLFSAIDGLNEPVKEDKVFLLFLPEAEYHEISLLFAAYMIKQEGYKVIYLGSDVPYDSVMETIAVVQPTHLVTFFIVHRLITKISNYISKLNNDFSNRKIGIAGSALKLAELNIPDEIEVFQHVDDLQAWLNGSDE